MKLMKLLLALAVAALLCGAQQSRPQDRPVESQATVRSTSQEVLLDVVVRDKKGHLVKDLTAKDFGLLDDGQPQTIRSFRLVRQFEEVAPDTNTSGPVAPTVVGATGGKPGTALDPLRQIRIISLVFGPMGPDARKNARSAVENLLKTEAGSNLFFGVFSIDQRLRIVQPYTLNKDLIWKAVDRVTRTSSSVYKAEEDQPVSAGPDTTTGGGPPSGAGGGDVAAAFAQMTHDMAQFNEDVESGWRSRAVLIALESLIGPQSRLPGRKTVLYFCEGLYIDPMYKDEFQALISTANRGNVSVYGFDARGLTSLSPSAGGLSAMRGALAASAAQQLARGGPVSRDQMTIVDHSMVAIQANSQLALMEISEKTGGFMVANTNDMGPGMRHVTEDLDTHYELAYSPSITVYDGHFRSIAVTVKRPEAHVQTRNGYYALPYVSGQSILPYEVPMLSALSARVLPSDIPFRSLGLHFKSSTGDPLAVVVVDVPLAGIEFAQDKANHAYQTHFSVLALLKDLDGTVLRKLSQDVPRQGPIDKLEAFKNGHFIYSQYASLPPGRYILETAIIDRQTGKMSAMKSSVLIPPSSENLAISSLVRVRSVSSDLADTIASDNPFQVASERISPSLDETTHAGPGSQISLFFAVYVPPGSTTVPRVSMEFLQDGNQIGRATPELHAPDSRGIIPYIAATPLDSFKPGQYEVRVTVSNDGKTASERTLLVIE
jgi:VWFA-related protein